MVGSCRKAGNPLGIVVGLVGRVFGGMGYCCKGGVVVAVELGSSGLVRLFDCLGNASIFGLCVEMKNNQLRRLSLVIYKKESMSQGSNNGTPRLRHCY